MPDNDLLLEGLGLVRLTEALIDEHLREQELDGFLAAYFLNRFLNEDRHSVLAGKLDELGTSPTFTRSHIAMLGVALHMAWLPPTPALVTRFVDGFERLERQRPGPELGFRQSLKLLWGVALGATAAEVIGARPDLCARCAVLLDEYRTICRGRPRDWILASHVLALADSGRRASLARDLRHYVLGLRLEDVSDEDALAMLWALHHRGAAPDGAPGEEREFPVVEEQLRVRLLKIKSVDDIVDALLADDLMRRLVRDLAGGLPRDHDALSVTLRTFEAFPELARHLRERARGKPAYVIEDEYDVQDLLYVALKPHIPDLTPEEWTPKDAGRAKRIDFVSRAARLCIEVKKPSSRNHAREIPDELKIDIESYYVHQACDTLAVFVYDPYGWMADPAQQERQLSGTRVIRGRHVEVIVRIRPR